MGDVPSSVGQIGHLEFHLLSFQRQHFWGIGKQSRSSRDDDSREKAEVGY